MSCESVGCGQCMEGVKSTPAPVCSFQRHSSGMAMSAPAAATKCAIGRLVKAATWPQIALPKVKPPNMTVVKIASPRPRTQPGKPTCAEMLTAESTAIHDTPAKKLAASATAGCRASANIAMAIAVPTVPASAGMSAPKRRCSERQREGARHRAGADRAQQQAIEARAAGDLVARHERQQRPIGAGEDGRIPRCGSGWRADADCGGHDAARPAWRGRIARPAGAAPPRRRAAATRSRPRSRRACSGR